MPFSDTEKKKQYQKALMAKRREELRAQEQTELEQTLIDFQGFDLWCESKKRQAEKLAPNEYVLDGEWTAYFKDASRQ